MTPLTPCPQAVRYLGVEHLSQLGLQDLHRRIAGQSRDDLELLGTLLPHEPAGGADLGDLGNVKQFWPQCDGLIWPHRGVGQVLRRRVLRVVRSL